MEFRYGYAELWVDSKRQTPNSQRYSVCNQLCLRSAWTSGAVHPSGKKLIPGLCKQGYDWDEHIARTKVKAGCMAFRAAQNFAHRLFMMLASFVAPTVTEIHLFADASQIAYGTVSYLRPVNKAEVIHCSFLATKYVWLMSSQWQYPHSNKRQSCWQSGWIEHWEKN